MHMGMEELEIKVDRDGNVTIHVKGVSGDECVRITGSIEEALGAVADRVLTGDYFDEQNIHNHEKVRRS